MAVESDDNREDKQLVTQATCKCYPTSTHNYNVNKLSGTCSPSNYIHVPTLLSAILVVAEEAARGRDSGDTPTISGERGASV